MRIGIVGDHNPSNKTHASLDLSMAASGMEWEWVATEAVPSGDELVKRYSGLWIAPASPYKSMHGALTAITTARQRGIPLVGT